mmetsp:Transcript_34694/g.75932  ORF Transcript_34694/g.75932 Transcript_34694/m.75932 type:complete len:242 (+) Transcript_34694:348-1073(+)
MASRRSSGSAPTADRAAITTPTLTRSVPVPTASRDLTARLRREARLPRSRANPSNVTSPASRVGSASTASRTTERSTRRLTTSTSSRRRRSAACTASVPKVMPAFSARSTSTSAAASTATMALPAFRRTMASAQVGDDSVTAPRQPTCSTRSTCLQESGARIRQPKFVASPARASFPISVLTAEPALSKSTWDVTVLKDTTAPSVNTRARSLSAPSNVRMVVSAVMVLTTTSSAALARSST